MGEAHVRAYERPEGGRYLVTSGNFQYRDVCEIIRKVLPEYTSKVPDPSATDRVETFKLDNSHAERELGIKFTPLEQSIGDTARSLAKLEEQRQ